MRSILLGLVIAYAANAKAEITGFQLTNLPKGSEVTLPQPATLYVPLNEEVNVASTDSPQSIRILTVNVRNSLVRPVKIAIFDPNQDHVRRVTLKPGMPFLYNLKKLSSVRVTLDKENDKVLTSDQDIRLMIESDKPLLIRR